MHISRFYQQEQGPSPRPLLPDAQGDWEDGPSDGAAWEAGSAASKPAAPANTAAELREAPAQRVSTAPSSARAAPPEAPAAPRNQPARGNAAAKTEAAAAAAAQQPAKPAAANIPNKSTARRLFTAEAELVTVLTCAQ